MNLAKVSKAIAGGAVAIAALWIVVLFDIEIPDDTLEWITRGMALLIAGGLGAVVVYLSPHNED